MLSRFKEAIRKIDKSSIAAGFGKAAFIPGRLLSVSASTLFSVINYLKYVNHNHEVSQAISFPYKMTSIGISVAMNLVRIPALFRSQKPVDESEDKILDINNVDEHIAENTSWGRQSAIVMFKILGIMTNSLSALGTILGSYAGGKVLSEFLMSNQHNDDNRNSEYYSTLALTLYLVISNTISYVYYVIPSVNKNIDILIDSIRKEKALGINIALATTATITAFLNVVTSGAFNYLSTEGGLRAIEQDINHFPPLYNHTNDEMNIHFSLSNWLVILVGCSTTMAGIMVESLSTTPQLYRNFDAIKNDCTIVKPEITTLDIQSEQSIALSAFKSFYYGIAVMDAGNIGMQGFASIMLTAHRLFGLNPYYSLLINLAFICSISKAICQFSFFGKKAIDDTRKDLAELSKTFAQDESDERQSITNSYSSDSTYNTHQSQGLIIN